MEEEENMDENEILKTIIEYKARRNMSDEKWAQFLGISWGYWSRIKNRQRRITNNFLVTVAAKCPEIQLEVFQFMRKKGG